MYTYDGGGGKRGGVGGFLLAFALAFSLFSCDDLTDADIVVEFQNARTTQITFYDQNPIKNPSAKSVGVRYEFEHTFNINTEYPKDLKAGYIPEEWKYIDLQNPSAQPPVNVSVDGEGKIQTVYVTQRALCFYAEGWKSTAPDMPGHTHTFSSDWESDDTNHWHICESCGAKSEKIVHSSSVWKNDGTNHWKICDACGAKFSKAAHDWTGSDTCECGKVQSTEVAIGNLVAYLSDEKFKGTTPSITVKADSSSDISSIKTALKDSSVTSNVAGVDLVLTTDSLTSLPSSAFYKCTSLSSVTIPEGVTSIYEKAFYGCTSLTSVTIPDGVKTIGSSAFSGCTSLSSVTIPKGVTSIEYEAFCGCTSLTSVTIPEGVKEIGAHAFQKCTSLSSVTIPGSVTEIGTSAFYGCKSLTSVTIPERVTTIGDYAFDECTALSSVTIPGSVTEIRSSAFYGCKSLTSVTIPKSVTTIRDYAFQACESLTSVTVEATTPPKLGSTSVFGDNASSRKIYVPADSVEAYKAATNWSSYADYIEAIPTP